MNCKGISIELKPSILLTPGYTLSSDHNQAAMWIPHVWTGTTQRVTKVRAWSPPSLHSAHCNPDLDHHTPCAWPLDPAGLPLQPQWYKDALNTGPQQSRFAVVLFLQDNWHEGKIKIQHYHQTRLKHDRRSVYSSRVKTWTTLLPPNGLTCTCLGLPGDCLLFSTHQRPPRCVNSPYISVHSTVHYESLCGI